MGVVNLSAFYPYNAVASQYPEGTVVWFHPQSITPSSWESTCYGLFCWTVPSGVTSAKFEIWGGGGGGAGMCCCAGGQPGGSGAYASKLISVTAGSVYCANVAGYCHCCTSSSIGIRGQSTFVLGSGLNNFCAEGGTPGVSCCYCFTGIASGDAACADVYNCDWTSLPCYYGADYGAIGKNGFYQVSCCGCSDVSAVCGYRSLVPYPGGLVNKYGGYLAYVACAQAISTTEDAYVQMFMSGYPSQCAKIPGIGGITSRHCGGSCVCGTLGGTGALRITYS